MMPDIELFTCQKKKQTMKSSRDTEVNQDLFGEIAQGDERIRKEWYFARWYINSDTSLLNTFFKLYRNPENNKNINIVFDGYSRPVVAVARQIALLAHFPNFNEKNRENATRITFLVDKDDTNSADDFLRNFEYFRNLYVLSNSPDHSYLDIIFEITSNRTILESDNVIVYDRNEIDRSFVQFVAKESININKAMMLNMVYRLGGELHNIVLEDTNCIERYKSALLIYSAKTDAQQMRNSWDSIGKGKPMSAIRLKLSCLLCADSIGLYCGSDIKQWDNFVSKNIKVLAKCEHSRWNVEKLIMEHTPFSKRDRYNASILFNDEKANFYKTKKDDFCHPAICSNHDLSLYHPELIKYDVFLLLASPIILGLK